MAEMGEIKSQADTTVDRIDHLESEMDEITGIVNLIDAAVTAYTSLSSSNEYPNEINIAGRQRMLSQRIAKQTLYIARNERAGEISEEIQAAKNDLKSDIKEFQHAPEALDDGGPHRKKACPCTSGSERGTRRGAVDLETASPER